MRTPIIIVAALSAACVCCRPTTTVQPPPSEIPPPAPLPDGDGLDTPLGLMCQRLRQLACEEGFARTKNGRTRTCYQAMTLASEVASIPVACVTYAASQEDVRACGDPAREITFRCRLH